MNRLLNRLRRPITALIAQVRRNPVLLATAVIAVIDATQGLSLRQVGIAAVGVIARRYTSPAAEVAAGKALAAADAYAAGIQDGTDSSYSQGFDDGVSAERAAPGSTDRTPIQE